VGFGIKGQVAMEFVFMVMLAFMILVVFTAVVRVRYTDVKMEGEYVALKDVVGMMQSEINTAFGVSDDYRRDFDVPDLVEGFNYTVEIHNGYLIGSSENFEVGMRIPPVSGNFTKGNNTITKKGGAVFINQ
jgi:hypothetical protein